MKAEIKRYKEAGIAVLEAAGVLSLLLTVLFAAFGLVEYMRAAREINFLLDRMVHEAAVRPYILSSSQSGARLVLNSKKLEPYIEELAARITAEFGRAVSGRIPLVAESAYIEAEVDPESGTAALPIAGPTHQAVTGDLSLLAKLDSRGTLEKQFLAYIKGQERAVFLAVPSAHYGLDGSMHRYLPASVLVGVRAGADLKETLVGGMLSAAGIDPFISDYKIVALRGEIEDEA